MKTLDEVIEKYEAVPYLSPLEADALQWLKGYRAHIELDKLRDKCETENDPLSWDELRTMKGKPIFVEGSHGPALRYKGWALISFDRQGDDMKCQLYNSSEFWIGEEDYGTDWQAYRKERM